MRSPSSLIFLVLLGVWAAYFVQHWVRRRDHIATARSVEQFTEAMRVLERRVPLPRTDLTQQAPRSYAVHPARAHRPQVLVKRAVAAEPTGPLTVTARVTDTDSGAVSSHPRTPATAAAAPAAAGAGPRPAAPVRRPAAPVRPRLRPSHRVRGLFVLASLAELAVIVPLVALALLPLWALGTAGLAVVAAFVFLRSGVRAEQAMMRAHRRRQADLARLRSSAPGVPTAHGGPTAAETTSAETEPPARVGADASPSPFDVTLEVAPATRATASVQVPVAEPAGPVMAPIVDEDDMPLTWDPVPVPRPTYTMKAKAERPEVAPAAVTPAPTPVARQGAPEEAGYGERRVAGA